MGAGLVQLRSSIGVFSNDFFLCEAYVKQNEKQEKRKLLRFLTILQLIKADKYTIRGRL